MNFANPFMLWGLLLALTPIIIHLINRRRAKLVPFGALEFLLLSDKRLARRLKVRQFAVLALRVLLLVAVALAFAKPSWSPDTQTATNLSSPGSVVFIIDDSLSMQARHRDGRTLLEHAVARAGSLMEDAGPQTNMAIITAGSPALVMTDGLTFDRDAVARALAAIHPRPRSSAMGEALREAERVLGESTEPLHNIVVLSDQAGHTWADITQPWALAQTPHVRLIDIAEGAIRDNMGIVDVLVRPAPEAGPNQVRVDVTIANFGAATSEARVVVDLGEGVNAGTVAIEPGAQSVVPFTVRAPDAGVGVPGVARLESDILEADNAFYFTVDFGRTVDIVLVSGAPRTEARRDELFFLSPALDAAATGSEGRFQTSTIAPDGLTAARLEHVDVVVLANLGRLTSAQRVILEAFRARGGGILITAGDQWSVDGAASYGALLPLPVRDIKVAMNPKSASAALSALSVATVAFEHPIMRPFLGVEDASLFKAQIATYLLADVAPNANAQVIAALTGGRPLLIAGAGDAGRVLFWTTSIDRDWSDLVMRTSFVPLVHQMIGWLAGVLDGAGIGTVRVGDTAQIRRPAGVGPLAVERPDGVEKPLFEDGSPAKPGGGEKGPVRVDELDLAGHYAVRRTNARALATLFAVNADPAESDLRPAELPTVQTLLARPGTGISPSQIARVRRADSTPTTPRPGRTNLWPFILVGLFGLLLGEAWLVLRG